MKCTAFLMLLLLMLNSANSQGVFTNQTNATLQRVLQDFPAGFRNIRGHLVADRRNWQDYNSKVSIPGSIYSFISLDNQSRPSVFSWTCDMYESAAFEEAESRYLQLFNEIRNTIIRLDGHKPYILNGEYRPPLPGLPSNSIYFKLLPSASECRKIRIELNMFQEDDGWKIRIVVHNRQVEA